MKERKKTTLYVDPKLWRKLKVEAIYQDKSATDLLNELMENVLGNEISLEEFRRDIQKQKKKK